MIGEFLIVFFASIAFSVYKLIVNREQYFKKRNLKYMGPLTAFKYSFGLISGKKNFLELTQLLYNAFPNESIHGSFNSSVRQYIVRSPEAYKRIAIKDFDHFEDHNGFVNEHTDEIMGNGLMAMRGDKWRQMRSTLSPAFTGSKMRQMFELVSECSDDIVKHFLKQAENGERINIEMKDFFSRYTIDVIATCAFGIKVNSFADKNNEFIRNGEIILKSLGFKNTMKLYIFLEKPIISKALGFKFFDHSVASSFKSIFLEAMEFRKKNNISRPDMINILLQARDLNEKQRTKDKSVKVDDRERTIARKWNDNELLAQCFMFFFGGFDTSSTALAFAAHELVSNPDVQQKLYEEICEVNQQLDGKPISYEVIQKMDYLDKVISETLRKWPPNAQLERNCVKDYIYDDGKLKFKMEKGSNVICPLLGIQRDPNYFPNPDKFDPERFSEENKHNISAGTYMPFGIGPRSCIASRFALMEVKAIIYYLILNFTFEMNKYTQNPPKLNKGFGLSAAVHLELRPRKI